MRISDWSSDVCSSDLRGRIGDNCSVREIALRRSFQTIVVLPKRVERRLVLDLLRKTATSFCGLLTQNASKGPHHVEHQRLFSSSATTYTPLGVPFVLPALLRGYPHPTGQSASDSNRA